MHDRSTGSDRDTERDDAQSSRSFLDPDGQRWLVYEKRYDSFDRRSGQSLIFASDGAVRRVRNYPANWMELSEQELLQLSWKA